MLPLTWYLLWVAIAVCLVIGWLSLDRRPLAIHPGPHPELESPQSIKDVPLVRGADPVRWISLGVSISAIPLVIALVWTMVTLASTSGPPSNPDLVLDVTGHQWWWEVRYDSAEPAQVFATANEIHIPVGETVLVRLHGETSSTASGCRSSPARPTPSGQVNFSWIRADRPGLYRGPMHGVLRLATRPHVARGHCRVAAGIRPVARGAARARPCNHDAGSSARSRSWSNTAVVCVIRSAARSPARFRRPTSRTSRAAAPSQREPCSTIRKPFRLDRGSAAV